MTPAPYTENLTRPVVLLSVVGLFVTGGTNLETGREPAVALITATLNLRYGDGDTQLFEQALSDASAAAVVDSAIRELAHCAATLANIAAHDNGINALEWWSAIAKQIMIEGTDLAEPVITAVMRATYTLAECSVIADKIGSDELSVEVERELLLSQVNETINALRRLRRRLS